MLQAPIMKIIRSRSNKSERSQSSISALPSLDPDDATGKESSGMCCSSFYIRSGAPFLSLFPPNVKFVIIVVVVLVFPIQYPRQTREPPKSFSSIFVPFAFVVVVPCLTLSIREENNNNALGQQNEEARGRRWRSNVYLVR